MALMTMIIIRFVYLNLPRVQNQQGKFYVHVCLLDNLCRCGYVNVSVGCPELVFMVDCMVVCV
jgi:hypothetical protein